MRETLAFLDGCECSLIRHGVLLAQCADGGALLISGVRVILDVCHS